MSEQNPLQGIPQGQQTTQAPLSGQSSNPDLDQLQGLLTTTGKHGPIILGILQQLVNMLEHGELPAGASLALAEAHGPEIEFQVRSLADAIHRREQQQGV